MTAAAPASSPGPSRSPSSVTASRTVTTGSSVEMMLAVGAPTRRIPAKSVTMGTTVAAVATRTTAARPAGERGRDRSAPTAPAAVKATAAPVETRAARRSGSTVATTRSPHRT